jgi:hypothetical protein
MKRDFDFDSAIDHTCELTGNPGAFLISDELAHPDSTSTIPTDNPCAAEAGSGQKWQLQGPIKSTEFGLLKWGRKNA